MSEDTNGSAATGMEQRQKMGKEMIDLEMTSVLINSTDLACQKMKVTAEEQEDLLVCMELPAEEENIKLDGFGVRGKEANLHSDCERALQNLVLGGNPTHSMEITREVFRYQVRSGSRSSASPDFDPSDILHGRGGGGGAHDNEHHHNSDNLVFENFETVPALLLGPENAPAPNPEGAAGVDDGALLGVLAGGRASVEARPDHPEEDSAHHGEHVAGVGGALLAAQVVVRVIQHARHRQAEVGAEHVHEDRVPRVNGFDVVAAEDLVDDEDDDLEDGHDDQLQRRGDAEHHAEADEDGRGGEVRGDERAHVHVDVGPGAVAVGRGELLGVGDPILVNLGSR